MNLGAGRLAVIAPLEPPTLEAQRVLSINVSQGGGPNGGCPLGGGDWDHKNPSCGVVFAAPQRAIDPREAPLWGGDGGDSPHIRSAGS